MAIAAVWEGKGNSLLRWYPSHANDRAVRQRVCAHPVVSLTIPGRGDELRIVRTQVYVVDLLKDLPARLHPIGFGLEPLLFDQRLRTHALKHFPVTSRFPSGIIDRIGPDILDWQGIIFLCRNMSGTHV
jgi:hypothetical protein